MKNWGKANQKRPKIWFLNFCIIGYDYLGVKFLVSWHYQGPLDIGQSTKSYTNTFCVDLNFGPQCGRLVPGLSADDKLALVLVLAVEVVPRPQVGVLVLVLHRSRKRFNSVTSSVALYTPCQDHTVIGYLFLGISYLQ